jgi:hypothetical protein
MSRGRRKSKGEAPSTRGALLDVTAQLRREHGLSGDEDRREIVDIMTFCNDPDLLNLPGNNMNLFLSQKVVLKCLYMGSRGNRNVKLTQEELQWLHDKKQKNVLEMIEKKNRGEKFRVSELILVLGRRSSKTVLASIISVYEVYKLLMVGNGDPYDFYGIPYDHEIAVLNVATSRKQAGRLFAEIKARIRNCRFFDDRIVKPPTSEEIRVCTDIDLKKISDQSITIPVTGSVVIVCGHSNPDSLRGYTTICLLFDELAFYDEAEKVSGTQFYEALAPSVSDFSHKGDGIIVEISTPGPKTGIFYKLWKSSLEISGMLSFKMATWDFNPKRPYDDPELTKFRKLDAAGFEVEFGAEWPEGGVYGIYFPEELIKRCTRIDLKPETSPVPGAEYYFHLDPALSGDRYVLVAVRKTIYRDIRGDLCPRPVLSFIRVFEPKPGFGLDYEEIDAEVVKLCLKYKPRVVSYDQWNSETSLQRLTKVGVFTKRTAFNRGYKNRIYQNLRDLMAKPEVGIYIFDDALLLAELYNLKYKPSPRGMSIGADKRGDCPTDDAADCLAGASYLACGNFFCQLPMTTTVFTGMR